jgi:hypothetical protein
LCTSDPENFPDPDVPGANGELRAFILGRKRYCLYNIADDGPVIVRKCTESGLVCG